MSKVKNTSVKILVSGYVQGVGFRFFIARIAHSLNLKGYVKNLYNGDVEIYAEGSKELLDKVVEKARLGPAYSHIDSIKLEWLDFKNKYDKFEII